MRHLLHHQYLEWRESITGGNGCIETTFQGRLMDAHAKGANKHGERLR